MVLHKFQTRYSYVFEIEMCGLKLNCLALKFLESWISKTMLKLPIREFWTERPSINILIQEVKRIGELKSNQVYDSRS